MIVDLDLTREANDTEVMAEWSKMVHKVLIGQSQKWAKCMAHGRMGPMLQY